MFSIVLFGSCEKEWHENRHVSFGFNYDISFNQNDAIASEIDWTVEYKIIGDPNADTSTVNVLDVAFEEKGYSPYISMLTNIYDLSPRNLKSYDHLEFKVTTSCNDINVKPVNLEINFIAHTRFRNNRPDYHSITETIITINSPDTTIYFTWSPHNLPLH
jgi:hypothetical protein